MKTTYYGIFFMFLNYIPSVNSEIYKYVDENGHVHYTDVDPNLDKNQPKVQSLTIIEDENVDSKSAWKRYEHKKQQSARIFDDFSIISPKADSIISSSNGNVLVSVYIQNKLSSVYRIRFYLDGIARGKVRSDSQLIADVTDGEHTLRAEVIENQSRRVIVTSPEIKFRYKRLADQN